MHQSRLWIFLVLLVGTVACADSTTAPFSDTTRAGVPTGPTVARTRDGNALTARGRYHATVPPSVFGTIQPIRADFHFDARKTDDGRVSGEYSVDEYVDGTTYHYRGTMTCFGDYDFNGLTGNRAKLGGILTASDDPTSPVGTYLWWQAIDNDRAPTRSPNQTTLVGGGDDAANEAFCASSNAPVFGPFAARGDLEVRDGHSMPRIQ
jgi:hypothetical protein